MNTPHTPGPWKYEPETKTIRSSPANYWLASMNSFEGAVNHEANARLISEAPEMLAALQRLTFAALCRDSTQGDPCRLIEAKAELFAACQQGRAAIAKATGHN